MSTDTTSDVDSQPKNSRLRDFDLIVAVDRQWGIGKNNGLPWKLPGDMAHFVSQTKTAPKGRRNAVLMGRVNWESIPFRYQPLRGRHNVVLTRNPSYRLPDGVSRAGSFNEAFSGLPHDIDRVYVIGGGQVFAEAVLFDSCRRIYLTQIEHDFSCDVFFPQIDSFFAPIQILDHGSDNDVSYRIELWERL